jgi:hypothetical protein
LHAAARVDESDAQRRSILESPDIAFEKIADSELAADSPRIVGSSLASCVRHDKMDVANAFRDP